MSYPSFEECARAGFVFNGARNWILDNNRAKLAQDAALITSPNSGIPAELTAYIDPRVIEILTAPKNARQVFNEVKKGDWTTEYIKMPVSEAVGMSQPYSDSADGTASDVNLNYLVRDQYVFQTSIVYGDKEQAVSALAQLDMASQKQRSAAEIIDQDANRFALLGVEGMSIYGILNDPNLPASSAVSAGWSTLTSEAIYNDIIAKLFTPLSKQSAGLIDSTTPLKMLVSPAMNVLLGKTNSYGLTVKKLLNDYFTALEIVVIPQLASMTAGDTIFLIAPEVNGMPSAELPFGEKMRMFAPVRGLSNTKQKIVASTYGGVVYHPFAFASITGMDA